MPDVDAAPVTNPPATSDGPGRVTGENEIDGPVPAPTGAACGSMSCDAEKSDDCCPVGCTSASDLDCAAQCGNGVLEKGEQCDPPASCMAACPPRGCTRFVLQGSAAECTALCKEAGLQTLCKNDDGCCPAGCTVAEDSDCSVVCGNGVKEGSETCDPLFSCPTTCPAEGCQLRKLINTGSCTAECVNDRLQTACMGGDGCCPPGCHAGNDPDCMAVCDNGVKESGETCDPLSSCPSACPAKECQLRKLINPGTCKAQCVDDRLQTACQSGDDCCPTGCNSTNDSDCGIKCGNGVKEPGETCDPPSSCPDSCPAMGCQLRELKNPGTCKAACENTRQQTACASSDDCCPAACNANNDNDCQPKCGNGVVENGEKCEPVAECNRQLNACKSDRDTVRTGRGNPNNCTFECTESRRQCGEADGQCPSGCSDDPDCKRSNGSACDNASQCLSNRCTDGRCCVESCGTCEKCTASGGRCQLPSGVKVCNGSCISSDQCCNCDTSPTCQGNSSVVRRCVSGQCMSTTDDCNAFRCDNGSGRCRTSCSPAGSTGQCSSGNVCSGGVCRQPRGSGQPCEVDGECASPRKCLNGTCNECGKGGQLCCPTPPEGGNAFCTQADQECDLLSDPKVCRHCGSLNEKCCGGFGGTCDAGLRCANNGPRSGAVCLEDTLPP